MFQRREGRGRPHPQRRAVRRDPEAAERLAEMPEADEAPGLEELRLHHQHQGGATSDRAHRRVAPVQQHERFVERMRLRHLEARHQRGSRIAAATHPEGRLVGGTETMVTRRTFNLDSREARKRRRQCQLFRTPPPWPPRSGIHVGVLRLVDVPNGTMSQKRDEWGKWNCRPPQRDVRSLPTAPVRPG